VGKYDKPRPEYHRARRAQALEMIRKLKSVPCVDCGQTFHYACMDFDHVRGEKSFNISHRRNSVGQKVLDELAKCDVICANCHRLRTFYQNTRDSLAEGPAKRLSVVKPHDTGKNGSATAGSPRNGRET
jgi:hypothetical protein